LQRQFTLLPWCCGKTPQFFFAEPWKGVGNIIIIINFLPHVVKIPVVKKTKKAKIEMSDG